MLSLKPSAPVIMTTKKRPWEIANKGKAKGAFHEQKHGQQSSQELSSQGSQMVKATKTGLHEGPIWMKEKRVQAKA